MTTSMALVMVCSFVSGACCAASLIGYLLRREASAQRARSENAFPHSSVCIFFRFRTGMERPVTGQPRTP